MRLRAWRWLQAVILLVVLAFWARTLAQTWGQLRTFTWHISWPWLAASFALLLLQVFILATVWWRALAVVGTNVSWPLAAALWLQAQIARYLPGGIWDMSGRLLLAQRAGISKRASSASMGLEIVLQLFSASLFFLLALVARSGDAPRLYAPLALAITAASLFALSPPVFNSGVNYLLRLLRRAPLDLRLTYRSAVLLFLGRLLAHGLLGGAFFCFVRGLAPVTASALPMLAAAYVAAWLVGYLAVLVPTGIGVREAVLLPLIGATIGVEATIAGALGFRLLIALRDLAAAGLGVYLGRGRLGSG